MNKLLIPILFLILLPLAGCKEVVSPHIAPEGDAELLVAQSLSSAKRADVSLPSGGSKIRLTLNNAPAANRPLEQEILQREVELFERENPDIRIEFSTWHFTPQSFYERAKNRTLTDVVEVWASQVDPILDMHYAADITDNAIRSQAFRELNPEALGLISRESRIYGAPVELHTMALFYNRRIFNEVINPSKEEKDSDKKEEPREEKKKSQGADALPREFFDEVEKEASRLDDSQSFEVAQYGRQGYYYGYPQQQEPPPGYTNRGQREIQEYYNLPQRPQQPPPGYGYPQYPQYPQQPGGYYQQPYPGNWGYPQQPGGPMAPQRPRITPAPRDVEQFDPGYVEGQDPADRSSIDDDILTTAAESEATAIAEPEEPEVTSIETANLPQDWDSLIRTAVKLTNHDARRYGYGPVLFGEHGGREFSQWAVQAGLEIEVREAKSTSVDVNTSAAGEVAQFLKDLHWKYDVTPPLDRCYNDSLMQMFAQGKVVMMMLPATRETFQQLLKLGMPLEEIGVAPLPGGPENRKHLTFGNYLIINSQLDRDKREAAFKWLLFQIDPDRIRMREQFFFREQEMTGIPRVPLYTGPKQAQLEEALRRYRTIPVYSQYESIVASALKPEPPFHTERLYEAIAQGVRPIIEREDSNPMHSIALVGMDFEEKYLKDAPTREGLRRYWRMLSESIPFASSH